MLTFSLDASSLPLPWTSSGRGWVAGNSHITPYPHAALEAFSLRTPHSSVFVVREKMGGRLAANTVAEIALPDQDLDGQLADLLQWPLNIVVLVCRSHAATPIKLYSGGWATAPLCLITQGQTLHGHWDVAQLYPLMRSSADFGRLAYLLARLGTPYSRTTLFPEIHMLTERASAAWSPGSDVSIEYPPALPFSYPRQTLDTADVPGMFEQLMSASIGRWFSPHDDSVAAELSGGLDSAVVSIIAGKRTSAPIRTYGLIVPGETGQIQATRRRVITDLISAQDTALVAAEFAPFSQARRQPEDLMVPWGEYYHEAFGALLRQARQNGAHSILTGIGGDEISTLLWSEIAPQQPSMSASEVLPSFLTPTAIQALLDTHDKLDPAPPGAAEASYFEAAQAGTAVYLRAGIWPLYPYATPEIVEFCRSLPTEWRRDRRLQRHYLQAAGLPASVYRPEIPESFTPLIDQTLREDARGFITSLFAQSRLAERGLVDRAALLRAYERYCTTDYWAESDALLEAVVLELTLRTIEERPSGSFG
ncbi:asparagine synthase-related protein [Serratia proteamaculans]